jgi:NYN domain
MSRPASPTEARIRAIYSQLGVTFIHCFDLGKDTADKKIISDMWKFYASQQRSSTKSQLRMVLITGDRDFSDAIGQLRNLGVEVRILTGPLSSTAPIYDDYTLGMRVLPLLGLVEARAKNVDLHMYQSSRKLALAGMEKQVEELSKGMTLPIESN